MHKLQYSYLYLTLIISIKHCVTRMQEVCSSIDKLHSVGKKICHAFMLYALNCSVFRSFYFDFNLVSVHFVESHCVPLTVVITPEILHNFV